MEWLNEIWTALSGMSAIEQAQWAVIYGLPVLATICAVFLFFRQKRSPQPSVGKVLDDYDKLEADDQQRLQALLGRIERQGPQEGETEAQIEEAVDEAEEGDFEDIEALLQSRYNKAAIDQGIANQAKAVVARDLATIKLKTNPTQAIPLLEEVLELEPDSIWDRIHLGQIQLETGSRADAEQNYETALKLAKKQNDQRLMINA